ncbi:TonB-dependent receptor [Novosphingobium sp. RD2P27]|uniref:TonB-dependent receptor n=1 Tax=Novosphingobium kalidii TaxID=3230299 RepID=A0ABV2D3Q2_9SPHN
MRIHKLLLASTSVLSAGTAWAQAVPQESTPTALDARSQLNEVVATNEIIVSARRREESLQDVPQTVNVVTATQVEDLNLRDFRDLQQLVPGLTMTSTSSFSSQATVRGIAFVPEASGNNSSIAFYLNDAPISSNFLFQSTYDFGQFELQRGPQGTLRGQAAPSGSIAYSTRRPDLSGVSAGFNGTITDTHARKIDGFFNIPVVADVLAIRLAGVVDRDRGDQVRTIKDTGNGELNSLPYNRTQSIRVSARFEPTAWIAANVMYQVLNTEGRSYTQVVSNSLYEPGSPATTTIIRPFDRLSIEDQGSFSRQDHDVLIGNLDISFAGQRLSYVGAYSKQDNASLSQSDNSDFFSAPRINLERRPFVDLIGYEPVCQREGGRVGLNPTSGSYYQCTNNIGRRESHEIRLASEDRIAGFLDYVIGGFHDHIENPARLTQEGGPGGNGTPVFNPVTGNVNAPGRRSIIREGESTEKSAFGNLTARFFHDRLELSGGLRYIEYENEDALALGLANNAPPRVVSPAVPEKRNHTIYTASVKYEFSRDFMIYGLVGSSWRPGPRVVGNFSVGPDGTGQTARERSFLNLPDETSTSYEVGAKTSFWNGRGRLNVSAYYQEFQNYPFRGPAVPFLNYSAPGAPAVVSTFNFVAPVPVEVKGIEGEASFNLLDRWSLSLNASFADGRIKNGTIPCTDLNRDGSPDVNAVVPTNPAQFAATLEPGQTLAQCSGINRRSTTSPKFSANVQSQYAFDLTDQLSGFIRGLATLRGRTNGAPETTFDDQEAMGTVNLFAGVRGENNRWEVAAFVKNLFDKQRVISVGPAALRAQVNTNGRPPNNVIQYVSEYRTVNVTAPQEFGVTARVAIGGR